MPKKPLPGYIRYPGDYAVSAVAMCSLQAQGLWLRLEDIMHFSERYGYLQFQGKPMSDEMIARRVGVSVDEVQKLMQELEQMNALAREPRTRVAYSENLVAQADKRAGTRERVHKHRNKTQSTSDLQASFDDFSSALEKPSPLPKSQETNENGNSHVTNSPRARVGLASGLASTGVITSSEGKPSTRARASNDEPENSLRDGPEVVLTSGTVEVSSPSTLPELAPVVPADVLAGVDASKALEPDPGELSAADLLTVIALASPSAKANGWSRTSVELDPGTRFPIIEAIKLERDEQGISEREAALYLLRQVTRVTELVMTEAGWERYWTKARMQRFYRDVEYRNAERFGASGGGSNGVGAIHRNGGKAAAGNGNGGVGERNGEALRRFLGSRGNPRGSAGDGSGEPGGHAGPGHLEAGSDRALRVNPDGVSPSGVPASARHSGRTVPVLPHSLGAAKLRFPGQR